MDRPPPYFPQSSLSPKDEKRYARFKMMVAGAVAILLLIGAGLIVGGYYLFLWLTG